MGPVSTAPAHLEEPIRVGKRRQSRGERVSVRGSWSIRLTQETSRLLYNAAHALSLPVDEYLSRLIAQGVRADARAIRESHPELEP